MLEPAIRITLETGRNSHQHTLLAWLICKPEIRILPLVQKGHASELQARNRDGDITVLVVTACNRMAMIRATSMLQLSTSNALQGGFYKRVMLRATRNRVPQGVWYSHVRRQPCVPSSQLPRNLAVFHVGLLRSQTGGPI